jgi:hypothetical protein
MKLISKQHDYYDSVFQQYSTEDKNVFIRKQDTLHLDCYPCLNSFSEARYRKKEYKFHMGIVGFCGVLYPYLRVTEYHVERPYEVVSENYAYSVEDMEKFIDGYADQKLKISNTSRYLNVRSMYSKGNYYDQVESLFEKKLLSKFFKGIYFNKDHEYNDIFEEQKVAYFKITDGSKNVSLYPLLKDLQFYKVFDAFSAYQTIENYLCNILVKPDDPYIAPVDDKVKAESHGFDQFSFRKEKGKKKRKKG